MGGYEIFWMALSMLLLCGLGTVFTSKSLTDRVRIYDLIKMELDTRLSRVSGTLKNTSSTTAPAGFFPVGYPVKLVGTQWVSVLSGDEANTIGLWLGDPATQPFLEQLAQNAISALPGQILAAGPAVVDQSKIATLDPAGSTLTTATIVTALLALKGNIEFLKEPSISAQQVS